MSMERCALLSHVVLVTAIAMDRASEHSVFALLADVHRARGLTGPFAATPEPATWTVAASMLIGLFVLRAVHQAWNRK